MNKFENEFQEKMENQLIHFKEEHQYLLSKSEKKRCFYSELADNLFPPIRHGFLQYIHEKGMPLHDFINHVRSSQVYCINLLYTLIALEPKSLLLLLGKKSGQRLNRIVNYEFEFSPETNILGEWKSDENRPEEFVTAIDLRVDAKNKSGEKIFFLIEVKFTEAGFSECGGYNSGRNSGTLRAACEHSKILLSEMSKCYLNGARLKRRYFFAEFSPSLSFKSESFSDACPFRTNHQCLRIHSLARHLNKQTKTYFCLLYHENNDHIKREWETYKSMLHDSSDLLELAGIELINESNLINLKKYYGDRYSI